MQWQQRLHHSIWINQVFFFLNPSEDAGGMFLYHAKFNKTAGAEAWLWFALLGSVICQSQRFWINSGKNKIFIVLQPFEHSRPSFQHLKTVSVEICLFPSKYSREELNKKFQNNVQWFDFIFLRASFFLTKNYWNRCTTVMKRKATFICLDKKTLQHSVRWKLETRDSSTVLHNYFNLEN